LKPYHTQNAQTPLYRVHMQRDGVYQVPTQQRPQE